MVDSPTRTKSHLSTERGLPRAALTTATAVLFVTAILGSPLSGPKTAIGELFWFRLYLPIYIALCAWHVWKYRTPENPPLTVWIFAGFATWAVLSIAWAGNRAAALRWFGILIPYVIVSAAVYFTISGKRTIRHYILVVFALMAFGELIALIEIFVGWHLPSARLSGPFGSEHTRIGVDMASAWSSNRNNFGFFLALAGGPLAATAVWPDHSTVQRMLAVGGVALAAFMMWANGSRTALVMLVLSAVIVTILFIGGSRLAPYTPSCRGRAAVVTFLLLVAVAVVAVFMFVPNPFSTVQRSSLGTRWGLGTAGVAYLTQTSGLGVGLGQFPIALGATGVHTNGVRAPHNWLFYILGEFGVIGGALFLIGYGRLLYDLAIEAINTHQALTCGLFGMLLTLPIGALGPSNAVATPSFWLFIALAAAAVHRVK